MTTRFENYTHEFGPKFVPVFLGGRRITEHDTRRSGHQGLIHLTIPEGVSVQMSESYPISKLSIPSDSIEWDVLSDLVVSAQSIEIPDTISVNIEFRDGRVEIRTDDEAALLLVEQFYRGCGEQMGVVHRGPGEGSVTIARYPMGMISPGPMQGYEVIAAGATFSLLKSVAAETVIGA